MGAVDVGVGHDDDLVVAQVVDVEPRAHAAAERLGEVGDFRVGAELRGGRAEDVEDLAAERQERLGLAVARHLGGAAGAVALDDEQLGPLAAGGGAIDELAGQAQLLGRGLARGFLLLPAAQAFLGAQDEEIEDRAGGFGVGRQPVVEMVAHRAFDHAGGGLGGEAVLGLADECGSRMKHETSAQPPVIRSSRVICSALRFFDELAIGADALEDRGPEARPRACRPRAWARCCSRTG